MAWLDSWTKRIKLTIDDTNVGETLSDFPILIKISNSSGISSTDVTSIFTELGSDVNRKKMAVTISDEETQCYVEIEHFDYDNSLAWLWVKVPSVAFDSVTELYIYYDFSQPDNTTYVGDTNSTAAASVWTNDFEIVYHMRNGSSDTTLYDSTANNYDGTKTANNRPGEIDGKVDKAQSYYDGSLVSRIYTVNNTFKEITNFTVEALIKPDTLASNRAIVSRTNGSIYNFMCGFDVSGNMAWYAPSSSWQYSTNILISTDMWQSLAWVKSSTIVEYFYNGLKDSQDTAGDAVYTDTLPTNIGWWHDSYYYDGDIDEVRLSLCVRTPAWLKATYYSNWDGLVSFGSEQEIAPYYYYGYITEDDIPISRTVRLYYRDTGELVNTTTSSGSNGYYYLTTTVSGEHFIVAFDNDAGTDYNAMILDKLLPRGIE